MRLEARDEKQNLVTGGSAQRIPLKIAFGLVVDVLYVCKYIWKCSCFLADNSVATSVFFRSLPVNALPIQWSGLFFLIFSYLPFGIGRCTQVVVCKRPREAALKMLKLFSDQMAPSSRINTKWRFGGFLFFFFDSQTVLWSPSSPFKAQEIYGLFHQTTFFSFSFFFGGGGGLFLCYEVLAPTRKLEPFFSRERERIRKRGCGRVL